MFRIAREGLALASVAGFVWMVCQVAHAGGLSRAPGGEGRVDGAARRRASSICGCARPIRCWKARSRPTRSASWRARPACRRWRSPTGPTSSARWSSRSRPRTPGVQPIIGCALPVTGIGEGPPERWARIPTDRAAGAERDRLAQPDRAVVGRLSSTSRPTDRAARAVGEGRRARRGADPALRRPGRAGRSAVRRRPRRPRRERRWREMQRGVRATASTSSCSATAWRPRRPPSRAWWPSPTSTTSRWWRPTTSISPGPRSTARTTRCCASPTAPSSARTSAAG